jgi:thioredoxin-related protein
MRFLARLCIALLALSALATGARAVEWKGWNAGLSAAAASRRPVVVDVYTDWCRWCKQMDRDVYGRAEVGRYLDSHFVTVKLNAEGGESVTYQGRSTNARSLASSFGVSGYPTTIFLTADGEHLANVPGYIEPARFLLLLRYIGDGHMDRGEKWDDFVKQSGTAK